MDNPCFIGCSLGLMAASYLSVLERHHGLYAGFNSGEQSDTINIDTQLTGDSQKRFVLITQSLMQPAQQ